MGTMKIGILTRNPRAWCSQQLIRAIRTRNCDPICINFPRLAARVGYAPRVGVRGFNITENIEAIIVRPIGRCSLDQAIFRMDLLHKLCRLGKVVINNPSAIEKCIDKYYALSLLEERGIPIPRTVVTESVREAINAFYELGKDVVVKPLFGSRGRGITRITDPEVARRVFNTLRFLHHVIYIQEFIPHGNRDIRVFIVGDEVVAAMYRESEDWKTNIALGAKPKPLTPSEELQELALRTAKTLGCEVAGVDILESRDGYVVTEVNSQPGWRG
ncbi:MAG: RimK family alpha-L-glutamate ligase, partial [Thermoprotei archaeon]